MEEPIAITKKTNTKTYLILMGMFFLLTMFGFVFYKYNQFQTQQVKAQQAMVENVSLREINAKNEKLREQLSTEENRCKELLLKEEGNFANFTYCQGFLEFGKTLD